MKLIGKIKRLDDGKIVLTPTRYIDFKYEQDKEYSIEISKLSNNRTVMQNKYLWSLINDICEYEDGNSINSLDLYCQLLQMANAKSTYLAFVPEALDSIKKLFRAVRIIKQDDKQITAQCFYGSSQFTKKEMAKLIDTTLRYASECGLEQDKINYYEQLLER